MVDTPTLQQDLALGADCLISVQHSFVVKLRCCSECFCMTNCQTSLKGTDLSHQRSHALSCHSVLEVEGGYLPTGTKLLIHSKHTMP